MLVIFTGAVCLLSSCSGHIDSSDPQITFLAPEEDYPVYIPDTIDVVAEITDDRIITNVAVYVLDENKISLVPARYYTPNSNRFTLQTSFELIEKSLASGSCQILVSAFDGENSKNKYRHIVLNEIPLRIENFIVISGQFDFKTKIIRLNPAFEADTQLVFPHAYYSAAVHALWEKFLFVSDEPSTMYAINPFDFQIEWTLLANPPRPQISSVITDSDLIFSTANGDVAVCGAAGNVKLRTAAFESKTISCLAADESYIYAAHVSLSGNIRELTVFYRTTGEIKVQRLMGNEIMSLVTYRDKVLAFSRSEAGAEVSEYDPEALTLTHLTLLPASDVIQSLKISDEEYLVVTDQAVLAYQTLNNTMKVFSGQTCDFCRYDKLNDMVYLVRDEVVSAFGRTSGNLAFEKVFPDKVFDFQILYNK